MALNRVDIGGVEVSQLVIGGNPFSGFSHQSAARSREMRHYYTAHNIKDALYKAEAAGINTVFARADNHIMRLMEEYWNEGGTIQWFAQTASVATECIRNVGRAAGYGAKGIYLHGGEADYFWHHDRTDMFAELLEKMRSLGVAAGFAAHQVAPHEWIRDNLDVDFHMCCYYDPTDRSNDPHHVQTENERWDPAHRDAMAELIRSLECSACHYKILAAGRTPIREGFEYVAKVIRPQDVIVLGVHLDDDPDMVASNVALFEEIVQPAVAAKS